MSIAWRILQLADSAFPAGGFAHSGGLEAMVQGGELPREQATRSMLRNALWQVGFGALPLIGAAHDSPSSLLELDARCDAFLVNHVANRASRTQGRAFFGTSVRVFCSPSAEGTTNTPPLLELYRKAREASLAFHHPPVFGAVLRLLDVDRHDTAALALHLTARGITSAAVRLGLLGPHEAQRLHDASAPWVDEVLAACEGLELDALTQTSPVIDLMQSMHDRLYSRLFQS